VRLSLSEISTVGASFAEDVAAYAAAGFDAIGIWEYKLPDDDDANRELLREHGLAVANCVPVVPSVLQLEIPGLEGPADPDARIALVASMHRLAAYEPESVLCLSGPVGARSLDEARTIVLDGLSEVAVAARAAGVRLGLEPVNPLLAEAASFVTSLADAAALLDAAGLDDVGVMLDTYHAWDDAGAAEWSAANAGRVTGVHVCDRPGDPTRGDRLLPGESGSRTAELVTAVRSAGWDGSLDVEIFSEPTRFWGLEVGEAARRAHAAAELLLLALSR
jgi:sugar phosphate isomerase/epimerase